MLFCPSLAKKKAEVRAMVVGAPSLRSIFLLALLFLSLFSLFQSVYCVFSIERLFVVRAVHGFLFQALRQRSSCLAFRHLGLCSGGLLAPLPYLAAVGTPQNATRCYVHHHVVSHSQVIPRCQIQCLSLSVALLILLPLLLRPPSTSRRVGRTPARHNTRLLTRLPRRPQQEQRLPLLLRSAALPRSCIVPRR